MSDDNGVPTSGRPEQVDEHARIWEEIKNETGSGSYREFSIRTQHQLQWKPQFVFNEGPIRPCSILNVFESGVFKLGVSLPPSDVPRRPGEYATTILKAMRKPNPQILLRILLVEEFSTAGVHNVLDAIGLGLKVPGEVVAAYELSTTWHRTPVDFNSMPQEAKYHKLRDSVIYIARDYLQRDA